MIPHHRTNSSATPEVHAGFLLILPRITRHGHIYFRSLTPDRREEAVSEVVALSFQWYVRLVERGKHPDQFPMVLASFAARAVKCGRRLCGQEKSKDVLSPVAQQKHGFRVESLSTGTACGHEEICGSTSGQQHWDAYEEWLRDNTQTPIPDQVQFRIDFPTWLQTRTERDRRIIDDMARNERTHILADRFGVSPTRIGQLRREYHADWTWFCGDTPAEEDEVSPDAA